MELQDYIRVIWRRRWAVVLVFVAFASLSLVFSSMATPTYKATAKVFVGPRTQATLDDLAFSREFVQSYAELLRSRLLAERTVERLQLDIAPAELVTNLSTRVIPETRIIEVSATTTDPDRSALVVNTLIDTFVTEQQQEFGGRSGAQATAIEPAVRPNSQVSPRPIRNGALAGILGLIAGVGLAVFLEQLDTRVRGREQLERALPGYPVLTEVPQTSIDGRSMIVQIDPKSASAEAFRILRTNVQFLAVENPISWLLVTSPYAEDGKTTVAVNLAAALSASGFRTLLVESDLRRPTVHEYFNMAASPGTSDVLLGRKMVRDVVRQTGMRDLLVMTSGPIPPNPAELLGSQRMVDVLEEASNNVDVVVMDSPPALPVTDATVLAPRADGVILVVRAGRTRIEAAREAITQFERVGVRVLGIVLNGTRRESSYYSSYYSDRPPHAVESIPPGRPAGHVDWNVPSGTSNP